MFTRKRIFLKANTRTSVFTRMLELGNKEQWTDDDYEEYERLKQQFHEEETRKLQVLAFILIIGMLSVLIGFCFI